MIDPLRLCLILAPVAVYLLLIGLINLSRRPSLISGTRDAGALAVAMVGLIVVGPMELFFPEAAAARFGPWIWLMLLAFYTLCVVLVLLLSRPRLVIYNINMDQLRPILAELVPRLDTEARWAGDSLTLPSLGVQLHADSLAVLRNISLVAVGGGQSHAGWRKLERALTDALRHLQVGRNAQGVNFVLTGLTLLGLLAFLIAHDPDAIQQSLFEMLKI
jgi:hypothetical protein